MTSAPSACRLASGLYRLFPSLGVSCPSHGTFSGQESRASTSRPALSRLGPALPWASRHVRQTLAGKPASACQVHDRTRIPATLNRQLPAPVHVPVISASLIRVVMQRRSTEPQPLASHLSGRCTQNKPDTSTPFLQQMCPAYCIHPPCLRCICRPRTTRPSLGSLWRSSCVSEGPGACASVSSCHALSP